MYYLDSQYFGTEHYSEDDKIEEELEFTVLNDENSENTIKTNTPVLFSDLSNPITLKYVNIVNSNFKVSSDEILLFTGALLKKANVDIEDLNATVSFKINITSNSDQKYYYNLNINIPLEDIYSGSVLEKNENLDYKFLAYN